MTDVGYEDVCTFLWCISNAHKNAASLPDQRTNTNRRRRASRRMATTTTVTKKKRSPRRRRTSRWDSHDVNDGDNDRDKNVFSVERILAHRVVGSPSASDAAGVLQYLVKWEGFDNRYNRWVASTDMFCDELMAEYHRRCAGKRGDRRRRQ